MENQRLFTNPPTGTFSGLYMGAWRLYKEGKVEEAEHMCRNLLSYPELSDFHKAGCHYLLGCGKHDYLEHAQQAVALFASICEGRELSDSTRQTINEYENKARKALAKAEKDYARIEKNYAKQVDQFTRTFHRQPTVGELVKADMDKNREAVAAYFDAFDEAYEEYLSQGADTHSADKVDDFEAELEEDTEMNFEDILTPERASPSPPPESSLARRNLNLESAAFNFANPPMNSQNAIPDDKDMKHAEHNDRS